MPRHAALLGLTIAALAACSTPNAIGPIPNPDPTVTSSVPGEAATSTASEIVTSTAATPALDATTLPAETAPSTSPAGPSTSPAGPSTSDAASFETALTEAAREYWRSRRNCLAEPTACDPGTFTLAGSELHRRLSAGVTDRVEKGAYGLLDDVTTFEVLKVLRLGEDLASVTACEVNGDVLMDSNGTPDQVDDIIRNDRVETTVGEFIFHLGADGWLAGDYTRSSTVDGVSPCVAA